MIHVDIRYFTIFVIAYLLKATVQATISAVFLTMVYERIDIAIAGTRQPIQESTLAIAFRKS